jgi:hypothetical protein
MQSVLGPGHLVAGRYRLLDQLGRGAMGIVWRGHDDLLDREVAIKQIVLPPMASENEAATCYQRTLREARTAARLSHPGVVTVFDVIEADDTPWIVMELIRARPLDHVIAEDGPLPAADATRLGMELLDALATAHAAGVLHRDVKPSNVLIKADGTAVLTDFGIATIQGDPAFTQAGMVVGTPGFAPPERVRGEPATPASDLWSLGATLYCAVEGRGPFDRAGGSAAIVASVATEPAPRAPSAGPLAPVIEALLRADPGQRPDAAATSWMLADADSASRAPRRARGQSATTPGQAAAAAGGSGQPGLEATTATQVVGIPAVIEPVQGGVAADAGASDGQPGGQAGGPRGQAGGPRGTRPGTAPVAGTAAADGTVAGGPGAATGPVLAGPVLAGAGAAGAGLAGAGAAGAGLAGAGAAGAGLAPGSDVVPDLMATPVFAELKMPVPAASPDLPQNTSALSQNGPLGPPDPASPASPSGSPDQPAGRRPAGSGLSRRTAVLLAAAAAVIVVIGGVWIAFPGLTASLAQNFEQAPPRTAASVGPAVTPPAHGRHPGTKGHPAPGAQSGTPGPSAGHQPSGKPSKPGSPAPSGHPSQSVQPTPSGHASPSASPSPSPSPDPTPSQQTPPPGYVWQTVTAASIGTTAGFRLAAPAAWLMTPGLITTIKPATGSAHMKINLTPFAVQGPVREARHLQATAIATHRYAHYHLVSILAVTFHGRPAATWQFWWRPNSSLVAVDVSEVIFTAKTSAGPQPYVLLMSAPATRAGWASGIFRVAMRTFKPVP